MAQKYAGRVGITLASAQAGGGGGGGAAMIDSAAMEALTKSQRHLVGQQMELFARYLDKDLRSGDKLAVAEKEISAKLRAQLDLWMTEHGEFYATGIKPVFSRLKARVYDSSWNWVRQDAMNMFYDIIFGRLSAVSRDIVARYIQSAGIY
jgi:fatty acid synthase subunit alpha, fungi type